MTTSELKLSVLLYGMLQMLRTKPRRYPALAERIAQRNLTAQIKPVDNAVGRYFSFRGGKIDSRRGIHPAPEISIGVASAELGARIFNPWMKQLDRIEIVDHRFAAKSVEFNLKDSSYLGTIALDKRLPVPA